MRLLCSCFLLVKRGKVLHRLHKFCSDTDISGTTIKEKRTLKNKMKKGIRPTQFRFFLINRINLYITELND